MVGFVERHGLRSAEQEIDALLRRVQEAGLEAVRISFVDQHGVPRGKTMMVDGLAAALENGVAMTSTLLLKDTSHRTVFPVWQADAGFGPGRLTGAGDVIMVPDPATFRILPWSPQNGWLLADLYYPDGQAVPVCSRAILRQALARLHDKGHEIVTGLEVEFHVLRLLDPHLSLEDAGQPGTPPETALMAQGYQYLTEQRYDELEPVFDVIRKSCLGLGLPLATLEVEFGPSQIEATFQPAGALANADNMVLFRSMVKAVCRRQGWHATFMCRPRFDAAMASGWHLHQSLVDGDSGRNLFEPGPGEAISELGRHWIAGLLEHAAASCLFATPTINGYKRYRPHALAPDRIQWGVDNKGAMIRALAAPGNRNSRVENRIGEPAANPYLYIASQVLAGLDGIERQLRAPDPVERPYDSDAPALPKTLLEAIESLSGSAFHRAQLGDPFVDYITRIKRAEWDRYLAAVSEWEEREYLSLF